MLRDYDDVDLTSDCGIEVHLRVLTRWAYIHAATNSQVCIHSYIAIEIRIFFFAMHVHQNQLLKLKRHGIPPLGFAVPFCTCHASSPNCSMLASAALEVLNASRITALFVVDRGKPVGIVHVHDLLRVGVV